MAGKPRKHPKVRVKWLPRHDDGLQYAILVWSLPGQSKEKTQMIGYSTPENAENARKDQEAALRLGVKLSTDGGKAWNVDDAIKGYLADLEARTAAKYTKNETHRLIAPSVHLGTVALERLTTRRLEAFAAARHREGVKRNTVTEEIAAVRRAFQCAIDLKLVDVPVPPTPR